MNLNNMKKEELELLSFTDLTEIILKESKKAMNTPSIFKKICQLLDMSDEDYQNKIGDYYTSLTTDKRFIHLENAEWDLRDRHKLEIIDYDEDEEEDDDENDEDDSENMDSEEMISSEEDVTDDDVDLLDDDSLDTDDDLDDLSIIEDDDEDEDN